MPVCLIFFIFLDFLVDLNNAFQERLGKLHRIGIGEISKKAVDLHLTFSIENVVVTPINFRTSLLTSWTIVSRQSSKNVTFPHIILVFGCGIFSIPNRTFRQLHFKGKGNMDQLIRGENLVLGGLVHHHIQKSAAGSFELGLTGSIGIANIVIIDQHLGILDGFSFGIEDRNLNFSLM